MRSSLSLSICLREMAAATTALLEEINGFRITLATAAEQGLDKTERDRGWSMMADLDVIEKKSECGGVIIR